MTHGELDEALKNVVTLAGDRITRSVAIYACTALVIFTFSAWVSGGYDYDSTDGNKRSGMKPHTDAATGCQYLSTSAGITRRMASDGTQYGCR